MSTYGLYVPPAVLSQTELSPSAILVLAEIINLHKVNKEVWATDQHFTTRIPTIKAKTVSTAIKELVAAGFITRVTNQRALHKRIITPTALCSQAIAESAIGQPQQGDNKQPIAESAIAPPNLSPNPPEPTAESAIDLPPNQPEPLAESANIKDKVNNHPNSTSPAEGEPKNKRGSSSSLKVKTPPKQAESLGEALDAWIVENASRVQQMDEPLTVRQWESLVADWPEEIVKGVLGAMHNTRALLTKYVSANRTCRQWCGTRMEKRVRPAPKPKASAEPEVNEAEVAKAAEQQAAAATDFRRRILRGEQQNEAATPPTT